MIKKKPVIYIVGPTASGKTSFSVEIAKRFDGEIISGDSMQIYKGMHIASAAPDEQEMQGIPHHLFEFLNPVDKFSVCEYVKLANETIAKIHAKKKLPIVVGGTGLYVSSLADNLAFDVETHTSDVRKEIELEIEKNGLQECYDFLKTIDPDAAEKISSNDKKRIVRAIEIYRTSGKTKTQIDIESKKDGTLYDNFFIGLNYFDREILYERINRRVNVMLENGLISEAENAYKNISGTASQAIGHKEFFEYFCGNMELDAAVERLKMQTRRYAKRQLTWFRKNENINWILMDKTENPLDLACNFIEEFLN